MGKNRSRNDNRANAKNPNNPAYKASMNNKAKQLNPNYTGSQRSSNTVKRN